MLCCQYEVKALFSLFACYSLCMVIYSKKMQVISATFVRTDLEKAFVTVLYMYHVTKNTGQN